MMNDLDLTEYRDFIKGLISKHIEARLELVESRNEMDGRIGRAILGSEVSSPLIQFPKCITAEEIDQSLIALAVRGQVTNNPKLIEHADEINTEIAYLEHLVLHEIAYIKNDWHQDRETDCDLWVYEQMHG